MTLKHMKIYLEVYRMNNVTRAAEILHMTQPAVSRAIQEIEHYYGVRLFERTNRRLYTTEAGNEFYAYALHIVSLFEEMEQGLRNWDAVGVLRIGASISLGTILLPKVMTEFRERNPEFHLKATVANGYTLQKALLDNQLDFAVMEGGVLHHQLQSEVISEDRLVPVLPPNAPERNTTLPLDQLAQSPLLLREKDSAGRIFLDHIFALHELEVDPILESISTLAILQAVHAGLGISFLPEPLVRENIQSGLVSTCTVSDETFQRENYLVWHKQKFLTNSAKQAMDLFRRTCSQQSSR